MDMDLSINARVLPVLLLVAAELVSWFWLDGFEALPWLDKPAEDGDFIPVLLDRLYVATILVEVRC